MGLGERAARGETWQMILVRNLRLAPEQPLDALRGPAAKKLRIPEREIKELKLVKRSLDARKKSDIDFVCFFIVSMKYSSSSTAASPQT